MQKSADFVVIGGGVIGISVARAIRRRFSDCSVILLEKESALARHASGRNSGVLHAGFYYASDSLKARFARVGNGLLTAYCLEKNLPIRRCGKLVVTQSEEELPELERLYEQGVANGVELTRVDSAEAKEIEPRARTVGKAIFSPTTSSVDPVLVVEAMAEDARAEGVRIECAAYLRRSGARILTPSDEIEAGFVVNSAGLQADRVARDYGFGGAYRILPFRGLYLYGDDQAAHLRTHIYPVPDRRYPFLGVHLTATVDGHVKIGPTAGPALWRENYTGAQGFRFDELVEVGVRLLGLLAGSAEYRRLAAVELGKQNRDRMASLASVLATGIEPAHFRRWGKPGIRAQLVEARSGKMVTDFVIEGDDRSLHILNAVSPGFTCALPFAEHVVDRIASATCTAVA